MRLLYRAVQSLLRPFYTVYGRRRVIGYENIPREGAVIFACNHVSYLDPPFVGTTIWRECAFMAQHELWQTKWLAWIMPRLNAFPVHRGTADRPALRHALSVLAKGIPLVLFPEGSRSRDGKLQRGEPGVALIVQKSGAPVVPIALIGPERMLPPGQKQLRRVPLTIVFGKPMHFTANTPREQIVLEIMQAIADLLSAHGRPAESPHA